MIGFTDRRLNFLDDWDRRGSITSTLDLSAVSDISASKAKINKEGFLALAFVDGTASTVTLPGPDSRELVRFLESARA